MARRKKTEAEKAKMPVVDLAPFNRKQRAFLENLWLSAGNITQACKKSNIKARQTILNWRKGVAGFEDAYQMIQESLIDHVESRLFKQINADNITAIIFFLKTKGKARGYSERIEADVRVHAKIDTKELEELSDEELIRIAVGKE